MMDVLAAELRAYRALAVELLRDSGLDTGSGGSDYSHEQIRRMLKDRRIREMAFVAGVEALAKKIPLDCFGTGGNPYVVVKAVEELIESQERG